MSATEVSTATSVGFENVCPVLRVRSVDASMNYYVHQLGFKVDFKTPAFASVSRGKCRLFLCEGDQGNFGSWVWCGVEDAHAVFEEYSASGAKVRHPPTNYVWAYEMQVEDLDGNVLRLGSDSKHGEPIGEWLDMRGVRWKFDGREWMRAE